MSKFHIIRSSDITKIKWDQYKEGMEPICRFNNGNGNQWEISIPNKEIRKLIDELNESKTPPYYHLIPYSKNRKIAHMWARSSQEEGLTLPERMHIRADRKILLDKAIEGLSALGLCELIQYLQKILDEVLDE